jgi:hypothetical protein
MQKTNIICRIKDKKFMTISIDGDKEFHYTEHPSMIKMLNKLVIKEHTSI